MGKIKKIFLTGENETILFAAQELALYLKKIEGGTAEIDIKIEKETGQTADNCIRLGLLRDMGVIPLEPSTDPDMDDEICLETGNGRGMIAGINPRSVLIAVYRYLYELGCRFVRPGPDGEFIPSARDTDICLAVHERPSCRHRGICIEGAVSLENVLDMIDFLPKLGMNSYFIQFREAYTFFERWYHHSHNPLKAEEPYSIGKAKEFVTIIEGEIKKRGLIYHAVGHGWTCEALGIPGLEWKAAECGYPPGTTQYFAEVNGERKMTDGIPLNLNLCYSNPEARELMLNCITDYLKENRNVDVLHFWLADGVNNQCECEACRKEIPTDFYVQMLNELDSKLTQSRINTKIVFLLYFDLLWVPIKHHIKNQDRFIMMFAPITRTYTSAFKGAYTSDAVMPYKRNDIHIPTSIEENLAYLNRWKQEFSGDSFDFDYHFMWDHFYDQGSVNSSRIVHEDIRSLEAIGLNGLISCQCQRVFLPSGLGLYTMANTLWNTGLNFDEIAADYFKSAFGERGNECLRYLTQLSTLFDPPYFRGERKMADNEAFVRYGRIEDVCGQFKAVIEENMGLENPCHKKSWYYLSFHTEICIKLSQLLKERALDKQEAVLKQWTELKEYIRTIEEEVQPVFDLYEFVQTFEVMNKHILQVTAPTNQG